VFSKLRPKEQRTTAK